MKMSNHTYIIGEIGVNHDGKLSQALELVEAVAHSGADAVKLQTFSAKRLVHPKAPKARYQLDRTSRGESQYQMLAELELSQEDHLSVLEVARHHGLDFLSTPYDIESLNFLVHQLGLEQVKIASADITNLPLLFAAGRTCDRVFLSTGMATAPEIQTALATLALGATTHLEGLTLQEIGAGIDTAGRAYLSNCVVLLQCTSQYPAPLDEANLKAITTMRDHFGVETGFSDHTEGTTAAVMSVALGSVAYERHITLDRSAPGPDHSASMEPSEFAKVVTLIRESEIALGSGVKEPSNSELGNKRVMRKSLIAARDIPQGHIIQESDISIMRPQIGDSPAHFWEWIGRSAPRDFAAGDPLLINP